MTKEEYLKYCNVDSSDNLTDDQILNYFLKGCGGFRNFNSASLIIREREICHNFDWKKGIAMLRQAFDLDKVLVIHLIELEEVVGETASYPRESVTMCLSNKYNESFDQPI